MTGLAIDTSADILSVSLIHGGEAHLFEVDAGHRHSERLMELVDAVLKEARVERKDIDFAACMKGPGSFTGLRIGMAAAKGMAVALGIPLYAVPTFDCIASSRSSWPGTVIPLIDAKQSRWYAAAFKHGKRLSADLDASVPEIAEIARAAGNGPALVCGPDAPRALELLARDTPALDYILDPAYRRGASRELGFLALSRAEAGDRGERDDIGLDYLRKSEAEITRENSSRERCKDER